MHFIREGKIYLTLAATFVMGALMTAAYSIWEQTIAMSAAAVCLICRYFQHKWTSPPLIVSLVVILINQALGVFYTIHFWKVWQANGNVNFTTWIKFGFSVVFLVVCLYAIYVVARNKQSA